MAKPERSWSQLHPSWWTPAYAICAVPPLALEAQGLSCLVWTFLCALLAELLYHMSTARHLAGALLGLFGSLVILFFVGAGQPLGCLALLLPVLVFIYAARRKIGKGNWTNAEPLVLVMGSSALLVCVYLLMSGPCAFPPLNDDFLFSLRAQSAPEPLTEPDRLAAVGVVHATLRGESIDEKALSPRFLEQREGRLWVTFYPPNRRGGRRRGSAESGRLVDQLQDATKRVMGRSPSWLTSADSIPLQIDLGSQAVEIKNTLPRQLLTAMVKTFVPSYVPWDLVVYEFEPGIDGLMLQGEKREGVVLPGDVIVGGWKGITPRSRKRRYRGDNFEVVWAKLCRRAGLPTSSGLPSGVSPGLSRFRTYAFGLPDAGQARTVELHRQNVLLPDLDKAGLIEGLGLAGEWLLSTVEDDGRFDYEYFPSTDRHGKRYNEVRHAGSVYGLFHMAKLARTERSLQGQADAYVEAGVMALDRVYGMLGSPPGAQKEKRLIAFLQETETPGKTNSGATALALLSFLERPSTTTVEDPALKSRLWRDGDDEILVGLASTLEAMIDSKGAVYEYWHEALSGGGVQNEPYYYPGEAMLALALYFERSGDRRWLEAAKQIGRRQIALADRPFALPDHWVMQALEVLDRAEPQDGIWREAAYSMARNYVRDQHPPHKPPFADYRGSFRRHQEVPRTTRAAARGEAVGAVMRIAWKNGDPAEVWERSVLSGARHLIEQMWRADNSFFLRDPLEARGAIRMGIIDTHCRIDNNQHAIVALGNALQIHRRHGAGVPSQ